MATARTLRDKAVAAQGYLADFRVWLRLKRDELDSASAKPPAHGLVLEIGPGENPHPRANVAVEKYIVDNTERAAAFRFVRPLVVADAASLPFAPQTFSYVIATHVLEHAADPARFAGEMERVATAGFLQLPTSMAEMTFGWPYHHWISDLRDGVLHMQAREGRHAWAGDFFHGTYAHSPLFRLWFDAHRSKWHHSLEWTGHIPLVVAGSATREAGATWVAGPTVAALSAANLQPLPAAVANALRCPFDISELRTEGDVLACQTCSRRYPFVGGRVPLLLAEAVM
jgi:methyltransferase family protein